jgi:NADH dehydrogenase
MGTHVVTGAFGYTGRYIATRLLEQGKTVRTLTNSPDRPNEFGGRIRVEPFHFDEPEKLTASLAGADVLYNTYWVRFNHWTFTHAGAVENTRTLFRAARRAGVGRIVHVSITNPSEESDLEYFRGKARLERELVESGLPHTILRPAVLFGGEDILVNNIAWALRRLPVFGVFGDGAYRLQPIHVEDFADLAVREGASARDTVIDAIGPETFSFRGLVETLAAILGVRRRIVSVSPRTGYLVARVLGWMTRDVLLTREEIEGLMRGLLATGSPPAGTTKLTAWAAEHRHTLGRRYASELARRLSRSWR